jgi:hypothetical protein
VPFETANIASDYCFGAVPESTETMVTALLRLDPQAFVRGKSFNEIVPTLVEFEPFSDFNHRTHPRWPYAALESPETASAPKAAISLGSG